MLALRLSRCVQAPRVCCVQLNRSFVTLPALFQTSALAAAVTSASLSAPVAPLVSTLVASRPTKTAKKAIVDSSRTRKPSPYSASSSDWWRLFTDQYKQEFVDHNKWEFCVRASAFAEELQNVKAQTLPVNPADRKKLTPEQRKQQKVGLQLMQLKIPLLESWPKSDLITRPATRELYTLLAAAIDSSLEKGVPVSDNSNAPTIRHAVVFGSSGIGKTRSLMILLKKLLDKKRTVVLELASSNQLLIFVPPTNQGKAKYRVFRTSRNARRTIAALHNPSSFYLCEPHDLVGSVSVVPAHTVVLCNRPEQVADLLAVGAHKFYMPALTEEECLLAAELKLFNDTTISAETVKQRYYLFGGNIHQIFGDQVNVEQTLSVVKQQLASLKPEEYAQKILEPFRSKFGAEDIPSHLFRIHAVTPFQSQQAYAVRISDFVRDEFMRNSYPVLASRVQETLYVVLKDRLFENFARHALSFGGVFRIRELAPKGAEKKGPSSTLKLARRDEAGHENLNLSWSTLLQSPESKSDALLYPLAEKPRQLVHAVILPSAADKHTRAFQIVNGTSQSLDVVGWSKHLASIGASAANPLSLYFVVPENHFTSWKCEQQLVVPKSDTVDVPKKAKMVAEVETMLKQYVLCVPWDLRVSNPNLA